MIVKIKPFVATLGMLLMLLSGIGLVSSQVKAQRLKARVYLTQKKIPKKTSERGVIKFARSHQAKRLTETKGKLEDRMWKASMVLSFNRSPNDFEFQILFYEVNGKSKNYLGAPMNIFVNDRKQKTFVQKIRLPRSEFKPNKRMELVVLVKRQEVGRYKFELIGEEKQHSGKVDFTKDEAGKKK